MALLAAVVLGDLAQRTNTMAQDIEAMLDAKRERTALLRDLITDLPEAGAVTLALAPGSPLLALDRTRMRLLQRNLLGNALHYSAAAALPPRIDLSQNASGVVLEVRDFGPGVDADQLAHLTEPFYRTDSARQRATGGLGLGLYLCQLVAQAHDARLEVQNAEPGLRVRLLFNS